MPTVNGNLMFVSSRAAQVSEVWVRAPQVRTHMSGVVTTGNDRFPVKDGEVSFTAVPGPAVLALISQGRAVDTIPILVGDAGTQTLRQVVSAAKIADDATKREIEKLAARAVDLVDSSVANAKKAQDGATRAEKAAGNAKTSETNAASSASGAKSSASAASSSASKAATSEQNTAKSASNAATSASQAAGSATSAKQDADRAANIANSTSWSGDKLTVNGKTSPSLTGPKGDPGQDGASSWDKISGKPDVTSYLRNGSIVQRDENGRAYIAEPSSVLDIANKEYVDKVGDTKADKSHKHTMADISGLPTVSDVVSNWTIVQRSETGTIRAAEPQGPNNVTTQRYVDTAIASEKARTVGMVWMVVTEAQAKTKEPSCQKGDFIQVAQTGNIYKVV